MLQKKPPVKPEHTERTGFEDAIRSRKAALGQRCAAGVPEMDAVDGFPARDMGMPAQDHIAGAHAGNGGATGRWCPCCATMRNPSAAITALSSTAKGSSMRSTSASQLRARPRWASRNPRKRKPRLAARSWKEGGCAGRDTNIAQEDQHIGQQLLAAPAQKRGGFPGNRADRKR